MTLKNFDKITKNPDEKYQLEVHIREKSIQRKQIDENQRY